MSALSPFFPVVNNLGENLIFTAGTGTFTAPGGTTSMSVVVEHGLNNAPATLPLRTPIAWDLLPTPAGGFAWGGVIYIYAEPDTGSMYFTAANPDGDIEAATYGFNWWAIG